MRPVAAEAARPAVAEAARPAVAPRLLREAARRQVLADSAPDRPGSGSEPTAATGAPPESAP
ncbi:MAG: hypothetical protein QOD02_5616 [Mycobacterium sp.]|nr:hypothetical protein [Mycobacterium sp.]